MSYVPQVDAAPLFGHIKWAISCVSAQELVGKTLSPLVCHTVVGITLNLFLTFVLISFRFIRLLIRGIVWLIQQVLKIIPTMG